MSSSVHSRMKPPFYGLILNAYLSFMTTLVSPSGIFAALGFRFC
jgi:hypothetical protein